jgi:hypothetical protein
VREKLDRTKGMLPIAVLLVLVACGSPPWAGKASIRAVTGTPFPVIVRTLIATNVDDRLVPGGDTVSLIFLSDVMPDDLRIQFLDMGTCDILGTATHLPRNARVTLSFVDPSYTVEVSVDHQFQSEGPLASATDQCRQGRGDSSLHE